MKNGKNRVYTWLGLGIINIHHEKKCSEQNTVKDNKKPKLVSIELLFRHVLNKYLRISVCKSGFLLVYGISKKKKIERLITLLKQNKTPTDLRGQITSGNAISNTVVCADAMHVESFPTKLSCHASMQYKYLESTLSVNRMYELLANFHRKNELF